eukprot:218336-Chlamydomonas_euryale.AAC.4
MYVNSVCFAGTRASVATGGADGCVRLWRLNGDGGGDLVQLCRHGAPVLSVVWSPDDEAVASSGDDGRVVLWSSST